VLRPARALLVRVSLGPCPSLHRLRSGSLRFVHRLPSYYDRIRLLGFVHRQLRLLVFLARAYGVPRRSNPRPPGSRPNSFRTCVGRALAISRLSVLMSTSALGLRYFSRLDGWPMRSPTDASPVSSRMSAHGSGPMWVATPSSQWTFTTASLPV